MSLVQAVVNVVPLLLYLRIHFICNTLGPELDVVVKKDILGFVDIFAARCFISYFLRITERPYFRWLCLCSVFWKCNWWLIVCGVGTTGHSARLEWSSSAIVSTVLCCVYRQCMWVRQIRNLKHSVSSANVWYSFVIFQHCSSSTTHTVHASNPCWWLAVPTAAHSRISKYSKYF